MVNPLACKSPSSRRIDVIWPFPRHQRHVMSFGVIVWQVRQHSKCETTQLSSKMRLLLIWGWGFMESTGTRETEPFYAERLSRPALITQKFPEVYLGFPERRPGMYFLR
ncbi:hypothetical protein TNCV_3120681 [Trichonephila clavipes]|uniref:Uncharacterized protein n=1 Tax=Trichonephila clavipes TaxID=2585209 RepID=A0A8X6W9K5_TRICX|nr:hypothetical protein TNCV_3120681 [Trichonephila clavipes]